MTVYNCGTQQSTE